MSPLHQVSVDRMEQVRGTDLPLVPAVLQVQAPDVPQVGDRV